MKEWIQIIAVISGAAIACMALGYESHADIAQPPQPTAEDRMHSAWTNLKYKCFELQRTRVSDLTPDDLSMLRGACEDQRACEELASTPDQSHNLSTLARCSSLHLE
jgi:hypothetical protein